MSDRTKIARIAASIGAQLAHSKLARAGCLKLTTAQPAVAQRLPPASRRKTPSMPRVTMDMRPTPERVAKEPLGMEQASGTRAYRVRSAMSAVEDRLTEDEIAVARAFVHDYLKAEAGARQRITADPDGMPTSAKGPRHGGVVDHARQSFNAMARSATAMDPRFWTILERIAVGVRREIDGKGWSLEEIGRQFMPIPYAHAEQNRAVAVGLLKCSLWRMAEFYRTRRT
jgi:hypothetical protein